LGNGNQKTKQRKYETMGERRYGYGTEAHATRSRPIFDCTSITYPPLVRKRMEFMKRAKGGRWQQERIAPDLPES
jgi:hypothetical protein